jgi:hypothetical protein
MAIDPLFARPGRQDQAATPATGLLTVIIVHTKCNRCTIGGREEHGITFARSSRQSHLSALVHR